MSKKIITLTYCGMEGKGDTVAHAKQDAARSIEAALSGNWTPFLLSHKGWMAIIARSPSPFGPWGYKLYQELDGSCDLWLTGNWDTRDAAITSAAKHLAQNAQTYAGLERWILPDHQRELDQYFDWQRQYAASREQGFSDQDSRDRADRALYGRAPHDQAADGRGR